LNYLCFKTVGKETKVSRLRFSDHTVETVTRLHNLHLAEGADITVAPDNSLLLRGTSVAKRFMWSR
jgi:hypothetical protein